MSTKDNSIKLIKKLESLTSNLIEVKDQRSKSLQNAMKGLKVRLVVDIVEQEKQADEIINQADHIIKVLQKINKISSNLVLVDNYKNIKRSFAWQLFPPHLTTLDDIHIQRTTFLKHYKNVMGVKKSIHPYCISLYSQYDKTCRECAIALRLPLHKDKNNIPSHEFRSGDLSILFYHFKKILIQAKQQGLQPSIICEIADAIVLSVHDLVKCMSLRMHYNNVCVSKEENQDQHILTYGDANHFQIVKMMCFEVLSLLEVIKHNLDYFDCSDLSGDSSSIGLSYIKEHYHNLINLYKETFATCETIARQQLGYSRKKTKASVSSIDFEDDHNKWIKESVMYQSLIKEQVDSLYECLNKETLYHKLLDLISNFKQGNIHLDFFLKTFYGLIENADEFMAIKKLSVNAYFYKYAHISKLFGTGASKEIEDKINTAYKKYTEDGSFNKQQLEKLEIDILVENISEWLTKIYKKKQVNVEKVRDIIQTNIQETEKEVLEDLIPLYEEIIEPILKECKERIASTDQNNRLVYDFNRATEDKLLNSLKLLNDPNKNYHEFLMDFLADKFSPFGLKINRTYDYHEHLQEINKMLSSELRVGVDTNKPQQKKDDSDKEIKSRTNISYSSINQLKRIR